MADTSNPHSSSPAARLARLALLAVILAIAAALFIYAGGWISPHRLQPAQFVEAFERVGGIHPGFRSNHAKGVCVSGYFESTGNAESLCRAAVFHTGRTPVAGRFSIAGPNPFAADSPTSVRGLGLQFSTSDGQLWRTAMINLPVFPLATPQAFYDQLLASEPDPNTGKVDPAKMTAFLAAHPDTAAALKIIKQQPPTAGFAQSTFRSLNAFRFTNAAGNAANVRWEFEPVGETPTTSIVAQPDNPNYLFDDLIRDMHARPLQWRLWIIVAQAGDPTSNATLPWPADRQRIDAGTLTLDQIQSEADTDTATLNFDPLVLPNGISPSDDPLLSARSAVYSQSFTHRSNEASHKAPSPITPAAVEGGQHP